MANLNAIKARLGSISDKKMGELPNAVQQLLKDLEGLINYVSKLNEYIEELEDDLDKS